MFVCKVIILAVLLLNCNGDAAKILGLFPAVAYSHYILGHRLLEELSRRGHEVTMVSGFGNVEKVNQNYTNINLDGWMDHVKELQQGKEVNMLEMENVSPYLMECLLNFMGNMWDDWTLAHPNVQRLYKEKFDLVIVEQFHNDALKGFCDLYKAPCVVVSTVGANQFCNHLVGNPAPPSYVPDILLSYGSDMTFLQRVQNVMFQLFTNTVQYTYFFPARNRIMHKYFPDAPHIYDIMYNTSLLLLNSDISTNQAVPHVPGMIEVGGFHVQPAKKLNKELQDFMDSAKEGVIYFSLGSNLKSKDMPKGKRDGILKAFSKLKMKVLWKFEEDLPDIPDNVKIGKWLPQPDILGHPNLKLFITHGGLLSTIEAIYHGIPVIGIPFFGDQRLNMENSVRNGFAIQLHYKDITEESLTNNINEILNNKKYKEAAKHRSNLMHDRPMKPMDTAVFWVEYVLRHKGATHLQIAGVRLPWYKYLLFDVSIFLVVITSISTLVLYKIFKKIKGDKVKKD